jgi:hypothetical protein
MERHELRPRLPLVNFFERSFHVDLPHGDPIAPLLCVGTKGATTLSASRRHYNPYGIDAYIRIDEAYLPIGHRICIGVEPMTG